MPWQHYGPNGREGIHGLTKEGAGGRCGQLAWTQTHTGGQTYAIACYNDFGGYTIGKVWEDHDRPAKDPTMSFPIGTVVFKTSICGCAGGTGSIPEPAITWQGFITTDYESTKRSIRNLSLVEPSDTWIEGMDALVPESEIRRKVRREADVHRLQPSNGDRLYKTFAIGKVKERGPPEPV